MALSSAFAQESVSRVSSYIASKLGDAASRGSLVTRLEMAVLRLEFAIERSGKLPITDVSLLGQRNVIKRACIEGNELLRAHKQLEGRDDEVASSSILGCVARAANRSILCLLGFHKNNMSSSTVEIFEQFAEWADKFLERVESGCSLRHYMISNKPLLRLLFEWKTLGCVTKKGNFQQSAFAIWTTRSEERGIEASFYYRYDDPKIPEKNFILSLGLRLSESTDIIGTAIKCLQPLVSQFKVASEFAIGELSQLATAACNLQELSPSTADVLDLDPLKKSYAHMSRFSRLDPICCRSNEHGPSGGNTMLSELSHICLEEVNFLSFNCHVLLEKQCSLRRSSGQAGRSVMQPLNVSVALVPHFDRRVIIGQLPVDFEGSGSIEVGSNHESRSLSIQEVLDTVGSTAMHSYILRPQLTCYALLWFSGKHGAAFFKVTKPTTRRSAKRKRYMLY